MRNRDNLLEWLEAVNPVPDPNELRAERGTTPVLDRTMRPADITRLTPGISTRIFSRGPLVAAAVAALIVGMGALIAFFTVDGSNVAQSRLLQLTFDGQQCHYEGPSVLSAGEVEITWRNDSAELVWASFLRLDEGKTTQDIIDYAADLSNTDKPTWTQYATPFWTSVPGGDGTALRTVNVEPGLHALMCGTWVPYVGYIGSDLTVVP